MTKLEEKRKELEELKALHKSLWDDYGSELSAGFMIEKEEELENKIKLLEMREEVIKRWEASGLLAGLRSSDEENLNVV